MTGRQEHNNKIELKIRKMVKNQPQIIQKYTYSFDDKTEMTKLAYINYVIKFVSYFSELRIFRLKKNDIEMYMDKIKYHNKNGELVEVSATFRNAQLAAIKHFYQFYLIIIISKKILLLILSRQKLKLSKISLLFLQRKLM